jgi:predicted Zn-ribbon and HTH transcriptional regulator
MKKEKDTVNIKGSWEDMLPTYAQIFQNLNQDGKKKAIEQLKYLGKILDKIGKIKL